MYSLQPTPHSAAYALLHALDGVIACLNQQSHTLGWEGLARREADRDREKLVHETAIIRDLIHDDIFRGDT